MDDPDAGSGIARMPTNCAEKTQCQKFLEDALAKLKAEYPNDPAAPFKIMNHYIFGAMNNRVRSKSETATKGEARIQAEARPRRGRRNRT